MLTAREQGKRTPTIYTRYGALSAVGLHFVVDYLMSKRIETDE